MSATMTHEFLPCVHCGDGATCVSMHGLACRECDLEITCGKLPWVTDSNQACRASEDDEPTPWQENVVREYEDRFDR